MKWLLILLMACVILAILKVALTALLVALGLALLFFLVTRPGETIAALGVAAAFGLASVRPATFIIVLGVVVVVLAAVGAWCRSRDRLLLADAGVKPPRRALLADEREDRSDEG